VAPHPKFSAEIRSVVCFLKVKTTGKSNFQNQDLSESFITFPNFRISDNSHGFFPLQTRPVVASPPGTGGGGPPAAALVARGIAGAAWDENFLIIGII